MSVRFSKKLPPRFRRGVPTINPYGVRNSGVGRKPGLLHDRSLRMGTRIKRRGLALTDILVPSLIGGTLTLAIVKILQYNLAPSGGHLWTLIVAIGFTALTLALIIMNRRSHGNFGRFMELRAKIKAIDESDFEWDKIYQVLRSILTESALREFVSTSLLGGLSQSQNEMLDVYNCLLEMHEVRTELRVLLSGSGEGVIVEGLRGEIASELRQTEQAAIPLSLVDLQDKLKRLNDLKKKF